MNNMIRVGDTVHENGKVIARFTHGAWYRPVNSKRGPELEPCVAAESTTYEALVDTLTTDLTAGEKMILSEAGNIVDQSKLWKDEKKLVMGYVRSGIMKGLRKYGPYNPASETRNLIAWAIEEARDIVVYASMHAVNPKSRNVDEIRNIGANAAVLLVRMAKLIGE